MKILAVVAAAMIATPALAQEAKPDLTPETGMRLEGELRDCLKQEAATIAKAAPGESSDDITRLLITSNDRCVEAKNGVRGFWLNVTKGDHTSGRAILIAVQEGQRNVDRVTLSAEGDIRNAIVLARAGL